MCYLCGPYSSLMLAQANAFVQIAHSVPNLRVLDVGGNLLRAALKDDDDHIAYLLYHVPYLKWLHVRDVVRSYDFMSEAQKVRRM